MNISGRIKLVRTKLQKSQSEFARELEVTPGTISHIENGGGVSTELLAAIVKMTAFP